MRSSWSSEGRPAQRSEGSDRGCPLDTVVDPPIWHASGTAAGKRDVLLVLLALPSSAESGAEGGEVAVECRVGTGLEDEVAFGVEDESAHLGDGGSAVGQEHAEE